MPSNLAWGYQYGVASMKNSMRKRWAKAGLWIFGLALATLILSALLSWPLPRFFNTGIPSSSRNIENPAWRYGIAGDHLQLMYHFDLMREMIHRRIPWFHNVYEFNTGSDDERFWPSAYFFPLSAVYGVLAERIGQATAWNFTWWLSVWLSALCMWGWLRRFTRDPVAIGLGVLIALLLPFRWTSLFGGSPSGMALLWVPLTAWGVDVAVREARPWAGAWVGASLLMCFWADLQVFYFTALATPLFALLSLCAAPSLRDLPWKQWWRVLPAGLVFLGVMLAYHRWRKGLLAESLMGEGRTLEEVAIFSPARYAVLLPDRAVDETVFVGWVALIALLVGSTFLWHAARSNGQHARRRFLLYLALGGVAFITLLLAIGVHSPREGWILRQARALVPYYEMIRQPFKIYAVMTMWLGWLLAVGWSAQPGETHAWRRTRWTLAGLIALGMILEIGRPISATITLLPTRQGAYEAVQGHAHEQGTAPAHALVVPLWPGDSAETSVPIYYAHRYNLRLVNGYSPVVSTAYFTNIFRRLESVNQGRLEDAQADFLLERGIHYVLLHENRFPERVSPFPVGLTRDRLMAHPRLALLEKDGPVTAFRILAEPTDEQRTIRDVPVRFPTRVWNFSRLDDEPDIRVERETAHGGAYRVFNDHAPDFSAGPWRVAPADDLHWLLRMRGDATIRIGMQQGAEQVVWKEGLPVQTKYWQWHAVPLPALTGFEPIRFYLEHVDGTLEADVGLLLAGDWPIAPEPGEDQKILAADFFHAGHRMATTQSVRVRPNHDPDTGVLYGPKLPLAAGDYAVDWSIDTDAPAGTALGTLILHDHATGTRTRFPVYAGTPTQMTWTQPDNHVVNWIFEYARSATVDVHHAVLRRNEPVVDDEVAAP